MLELIFLKRDYFKYKTYFYNNHVATFNLAKLHLVGVHPNPDPSEYMRRAAGSYMNSRSIKALVNDNNAAQGSRISKLVLFQNLAYLEQFDIVCVCETWLHKGVLDNKFCKAILYTAFQNYMQIKIFVITLAIFKKI